MNPLKLHECYKEGGLAMYMSACKLSSKVLDCAPIYAILDPMSLFIRSEGRAYV